MKKHIFALLAFTGLLAASCSNEAIEIETEEYIPTHDVTFNIATSAIYEEFGMLNSIKSQILSNSSYEVGVFTYIYDSEGNAVDSLFSHSNTFSQLTQSTSLKEGRYTIVCVETIVKKSEQYKPESWNFIGTGKLSTCEIRLKPNEDPLWYECFGRQQGVITLEQNKTYTITPEAIGATVDVNHYHFDQSSYEAIALVTKNQPIGFKFSPNLTGDNRYTWDSYSKSNYVYIRNWQVADDKLEAEGGFTAYLMEEGRINCGVAPITFDSEGYTESFHIYPSNSYYFTVENGHSYYCGINYKGGVVGQDIECFFGESYSDFTSWLGNITTPTPAPASGLYFKAPYTTWNASVASVKAYMSGYEIISESTDDDGYNIFYAGKDDEFAYSYDFASEQTDLTDSYVYFQTDDVTIDDLIEYFNNSSTYASLNDLSDQGYDFWVTSSNDGKTYVIVSLLSDTYWSVNFYDPSAYSVKRGVPEQKLRAPATLLERLETGNGLEWLRDDSRRASAQQRQLLSSFASNLKTSAPKAGNQKMKP